MAKLVFVLAGPRAGKNFNIPNIGVEFIDGEYEHEVTGPADATAAPFINILGSLYNAHPKGSEELKAAELAWEGANDAPAPTDLEGMTNAELKKYAQDEFNTAIVGNKVELLSQIGHLSKIKNQNID